MCDFHLILSRILTRVTFFLSGRISALSCVVCRAVYRGERETISLARQAIEPVDPYCRTKIQGAELDPQVGGGD